MRISSKETQEIQIVFRQNDFTNTRVDRNGQIIQGKGYPLFFTDMDGDLQNFLGIQLRRFDITPPRSLNQGESKYPVAPGSMPATINSNFNTEWGNNVLESFTTTDMVFNQMVNVNGTFYPYSVPGFGVSNGLYINNVWNLDGTRNPSATGNFAIGLGGTIDHASEIDLSPFTRLKIGSEFGRDHQSPKEFYVDVDFKIFGFKIDTRKWITGPDPTNLNRSVVSSTGMTYYALNPFVNTPGTVDETLTTQMPLGLTGDQVTNGWFQDLDSFLAPPVGDTGTGPMLTSPYYSQLWRLPSDKDVIAWDSDNLVFRPQTLIVDPLYQGPETAVNVSSLDIGDSFNTVTNKFSYILDLIAPEKPETLATTTWYLSASTPTAGYPPSPMVAGSQLPMYIGVARHTVTNLIIDWTTATGYVYATLKGATGLTVGTWNDNQLYSAGFLYSADWTSSSTPSLVLEESKLPAGNYPGYSPTLSFTINGISSNATITVPIDKRYITSTDIVFNTGPADTNSLATGPANPFSGNASMEVVTSNIYNKIWIQLWNALRINIASGPAPYYVRMASYTDSTTPYNFSSGYRFFSDSSPITPIAQATGPLVDIPTQNITWVSGVPTLGTGSQLRGAFKVTNFAKWFYPAYIIATEYGTATPNDGKPAANTSPTNSVVYQPSIVNNYNTSSFYQVDNSVGVLTDSGTNTYAPWQPVTVQSGRWSYPFSFTVVTTAYTQGSTTYSSLISPTGPSQIIVDSISDVTNTYATRVTSGNNSTAYPTYSATIGATTFGAIYTSAMHQNVITSGNYIGELQMVRDLWVWPNTNWTNLIPTSGPDYSAVSTPSMRWATFRVATGLVSITSYTVVINDFVYTSSITLNTNNVITSPNSTQLQVQCCMVHSGAMVTNWFDLNVAITGTPVNTGDGCLFSTGSTFSGNNLTRVISFGPSPKTGDLYVRIGITSALAGAIYFQNIT